MLSLIRRVPLGLALRVLALALILGAAGCTDDLRPPPPFELGPAATDSAPAVDAAPPDAGPG